MTLPYERKYAVNNTREFLMNLLDPKKTPRIPKYIRESAYRCLRHYPLPFEMEQASEQAPDVFGDHKPKWKCPINDPECTSNCGNYGCGN